jgi:hypothetical protein
MRHLRQLVRFGLLIACLGAAGLCVGGCARFEAEYAQASRQSINPDEPLAGAWQGEWQSDANGDPRPIRAVVRATSPTQYEISLELSGFGNIIASWIEGADLVLNKSSDGNYEFKIKMPLVAHNVRGANVWAEAVELMGTTDGKTLRIRYRTNDAMRDLDQGHAQLQRVTTQ